MKLHPRSLPYRMLTRGGRVVSTVLFAGFAAIGAIEWLNLELFAVLLLAVLLIVMAWEVAYHRRFEYELTDNSLDIESGVFSRRRREIPLRRVQNVDIHRNVVQRIAGIASLGLETAGGGETEASLEYVAYEEARRLQREIQRRKNGISTGREAEDETDGPDEEVLYEISSEELLLLSAVSIEPRAVGLVFLIVPFVTSTVDLASVTFLVGLAQIVFSALILWVSSGMITFARHYGFRLTRVGDELRYERGLLQRYDGSIPIDKIQTLTVRENPVMRLAGYAALSVETAGYAPGQGPSASGGSEAAIPLAVRSRVRSLAHSLESFEDPTFQRPPKRARRRYTVRYAIAAALLTGVAYGIDRFTGFVDFWYVPLALLLLAPVAGLYQWKHRGYHVGDEHVVTRNGFWRRTTRIVPYYRVQTVIQRETLFQRRWSLATVVVDTASSIGFRSKDSHAADVDADDAAELRELVARRLGRAVKRRRTERGREDGRKRAETVSDQPTDSEND
ncbi:PH domain-containing protein [Haladaptatus sp. T7]|uniref:PH domain-containing protein n=1 Tax=Haladaptatus sp. T7 TaxID=2029368 RepID=UPI0021A2520B|nr:PH domain-containing protein [Haladaptatus sp. T7]GKZ13708.1 membrane protein [Haladaptatus sp. T7]